MASTRVTDRLADIHPQSLRVDGEAFRKKLAIGKSVGRALEIAGIPQKDAAARMGYQDEGAVVSRWTRGAERPHFDKLFDLEGFEEAWMKARAETNTRVIVRTLIELKA